jgi:hypothetical protein
MQTVNKLHNIAGRKLAARHWTAGSCAGFALPRKKFVVDACESDRGQGSGARVQGSGVRGQGGGGKGGLKIANCKMQIENWEKETLSDNGERGEEAEAAVE